VSLNDWILALHLLSAFALVGATILFWFVYLATRSGGVSGDTIGGLVRVGTVTIGVGSVGTIVFGVWLAIAYDAYQVWDGWVIAAIVLWAIGTEAGRRAGVAVAGEAPTAEAQQRAILLHSISSLAILLILVDMIWKPGA
jgi:hypothetical protein